MNDMMDSCLLIYIFIVVAILVTMVALLGSFAAFIGNKRLMWTFAILMFLVLIIEIDIYVTIVFYKRAFLDATKAAMTMSMAQNNKPMEEGVRKIWDEIQKTYSCCGIEKPFGEDWKNKLDLQPNSDS